MKYYVQNIKKGNHYKKNKIEFDYLKEKDFKKLKEENNEVTILGSIKLKETNNSKVDTIVIESNDCTFSFELLKDKEPSNILGYVLVFDNTYVAITKNNILIPIILLFVLIGVIITCLVMFNKPNKNEDITPTENLEIEQGSEWDGEMPQNGEQSKANAESIEIPGYADLYVSTESPEIQLINPEGNTVYFVYTISEGDNVIYETKAIEPNKMVSVNLKELLSNGEHNLSFAISTYDVTTQTACNGATQDVTVTVQD